MFVIACISQTFLKLLFVPAAGGHCGRLVNAVQPDQTPSWIHVYAAAPGRRRRTVHIRHLHRVHHRYFFEPSSVLLLFEISSHPHPPSCSSSGTLRYPFPTDCSQELLNGIMTSGEAKIFPQGRHGTPVTVSCDMETDGGGWTV